MIAQVHDVVWGAVFALVGLGGLLWSAKRKPLP